jgi:DNA-binding beta-propeller fold protein YncE
VTISSFAGLATVDDAGTRLFVPSRSEGDELAVMDITPQGDGGVPLRCFFSGGNDCTVDSLLLATAQDPGQIGVPAAPQPYSVTLSPDSDEIWVAHLRPASSPAQSITNLQNFLVTLHEADLDQARASWASSGRYVVPDSAFSSIGRGASNSIVPTKQFLYLSGRAKLFNTDPDVLLRVVDRASDLIAFPQLQLVWASADARGLQLRPDEQRLYLAVDNPAALLVIDTTVPPGENQVPVFTLVRSIPLPAGPNDVQMLTRTGRAPLIMVSCSIDGSLAFYDDDLGQLTALIPGVGAVPFGIAIDRRGDWARLYVSNFGDGRIAVVDVPLSVDVAGGRLAPHLLAHVGPKQYCLLATDDRNCVDPTP